MRDQSIGPKFCSEFFCSKKFSKIEVGNTELDYCIMTYTYDLIELFHYYLDTTRKCWENNIIN